jgi:hypothetical protein
LKQVLAAAALLACLAAPALGHSQRFSDEENDWLNEQQSVNGTKCCDRHDAFVGQDVEWRIRGGQYEVLIDDEWRPIPPGQILDIDPANPTPWPGQALLFYSRNPHYRGGVMIWCFMPEPLM